MANKIEFWNHTHTHSLSAHNTCTYVRFSTVRMSPNGGDGGGGADDDMMMMLMIQMKRNAIGTSNATIRGWNVVWVQWKERNKNEILARAPSQPKVWVNKKKRVSFTVCVTWFAKVPSDCDIDTTSTGTTAHHYKHTNNQHQQLRAAARKISVCIRIYLNGMKSTLILTSCTDSRRVF